MKYFASIYLFGLLFGCGASPEKPVEVIPPPAEEAVEVVVVEPVIIEEPALPPGAVEANFKTDTTPFFGKMKGVDHNKGVTTIVFEDNLAPKITLTETYGVTLSSLRFDEFDRDLLLVNSKLKDPQFNKYYVYILKDGQWKKVVKGFSIHESHVNDSLIPITVDPNNPNHMFRYYSVFDLDKESDLGYTWRLFNESVPILAK